MAEEQLATLEEEDVNDPDLVAFVGRLPAKIKASRWGLKFIESLASSGNYALSCRAAKVSYQYVHKLRARDPDFDKLCKDAEQYALDLLEAECMRRARNGYIEPEFFRGKMLKDEQGNPIGKRKFDSTMAIFLLKAKRYNKQHIEVSGAGGGPLEVNHTHTLSGEGLNKAVESIVNRELRRQKDDDFLTDDNVLDGVFEDVSETLEDQ